MTLVEVMIALLVLLIVSLALMQTALLSIDSNMTNVLRNEAVDIADVRMTEARNVPFDSLNPGTVTGYETRNVRTVAGGFTFNTTRTVTSLSADARQVDVVVTWTWKGQPYTHRETTVIRRQS